MGEFTMGYNAEQAAAAEEARAHQRFRVAPSSARSRARVVTRPGGEVQVVHEEFDWRGEVREAVTAALVHEIQFARPVVAPEHFTAEQVSMFWTLVRDRRSAGGRRG